MPSPMHCFKSDLHGRSLGLGRQTDERERHVDGDFVCNDEAVDVLLMKRRGLACETQPSPSPDQCEHGRFLVHDGNWLLQGIRPHDAGEQTMVYGLRRCAYPWLEGESGPIRA